ncbi:hypothetical protein [Helicobacter pylori]|nr:hypothetical protein [Helicobacter pylori]
MRKGGLGGANTQTGIKFEEENDLVSRLKDIRKAIGVKKDL